MNKPEMEALRAFRYQVYTLFGCRRDALFETLDAVLSAPTLETPAQLTCDVTGTQLYILGGHYRVTRRGIEG